jgi:hypothetical protein
MLHTKEIEKIFKRSYLASHKTSTSWAFAASLMSGEETAEKKPVRMYGSQALRIAEP